MKICLSKTSKNLYPAISLILEKDGSIDLSDTQKARQLARIISNDKEIPEKAWQIITLFEIQRIIILYLENTTNYQAIEDELSTIYPLISIPQLKNKFSCFKDTNKQIINLEIISRNLLDYYVDAKFIDLIMVDIPKLSKERIDQVLALSKKDSGNESKILDNLFNSFKDGSTSFVQMLEKIYQDWNDLLKKEKKNIQQALKFAYEEIKAENEQKIAPERLLVFSERKHSQFKKDDQWKKDLVLINKNTNVWLYQLSKKYNKNIIHLNQIPDQEIEQLSKWGFNCLWLIGIWTRSPASKKIKQLYGYEDTTSSAYSIMNYQIAESLGGTEAINDLFSRCKDYGIRLCIDFVPNHTSIDSDWLLDHPDWYISTEKPPVESWTYKKNELSPDQNHSIQIEDGYYTRTGAAEVFQLKDYEKDTCKYVYHGNDGTSMPWNDTAQLNYLNSNLREHVIQTILKISEKFPIIRFDAAMTLTKKHYQRLWFPNNLKEQSIPTRKAFSLSEEEFDRLMPNEFWKEAIVRIEQENPEAVLIAEAFWLMEGFFINELGMHRVYNSAFMNLLRDEDNKKYRQIIKNALKSDPQILGKFVNFLNNPDERTALDQFGKSNKYFGICTMLVTMPGMPLFGHGQIEGLSERYGMDFLIPKWDESEDKVLIKKHEEIIIPLLKKRECFSDPSQFYLFDFINSNNLVEENVYAYLTHSEEEYYLILYNNSYNSSKGKIYKSVPINRSASKNKQYKFVDIIPKKPNKASTLCLEDFYETKDYEFPADEISKFGPTFSLNPYESRVMRVFWKLH